MNERILVVDDTEAIRDGVTDALAAEGFAVTAASTGEAALEAFEAEPFDLVILDVMLPGLSGMEICRRIRAESPVPIIMLTARDAEAARVLGLESGADDYITKPGSEVELFSRVRAILRRREFDPMGDSTVRRLRGLTSTSSSTKCKLTASRLRAALPSTSCLDFSPKNPDESSPAARSCNISGRAPTSQTSEPATRTCRRCAERSNATTPTPSAS
jgi:DNA-binding response OmpR family regulator